MGGTYYVLTLHAVIAPNLKMQQAEALKKSVRKAMADIDIQHVTVELETAEDCSHQEYL
ncbi:hypothetical protein GCM10027443_16100 [Pontibacter brevis]